VATQDNERLAIGRVWSQALLELAASTGEEGALDAELAGLVELLDRQPAFEAFLSGPVADDEAKRAVLERALRGKASDLLVDALQVLRRKKRLDILRAVATTYRQAWLARQGRVPVEVTTAAPLTAESRAELQRAADRLTGKTAEISARVDPELLGGMVLRWGDQRFDTSLSAELGRLGDIFLERASRELQSGNLAHDGLDNSDRTT
jgi:F-type H+-transporting ATPase subunit delta